MSTPKTKPETEATVKAEKTEFNAEKYWNELVPFYAFRDNDKYKDDIFVSVNEKTYRIKRGEQVTIPRNVAKVLQRSMDQDAKTANLIDSQSSAFASQARGWNV